MKFLKYLQEKYETTIPAIKSMLHYEVYKNPTSADIKDLNKDIKTTWKDESLSVRGIVDMKSMNIFLFPAMADIHDNAYSKLKKKNIIASDRVNLLYLVGYIDNHKVYPDILHVASPEKIIDDKTKLDWLKRYMVFRNIKIEKFGQSVSFE